MHCAPNSPALQLPISFHLGCGYVRKKKISSVNNSNIRKGLKKKGKILLILLQDTMLDFQQRTQLSHSHLQDHIVEESLQDEQ